MNDPQGVEVLETTGRLRQLPKIPSGTVSSQVAVGRYTHQFKSVGFRMVLQVLGHVPVRSPGSYDGEGDTSLSRAVRDLEDGS